MNEDDRPDPDALLAELQREEQHKQPGKLFIFLGMCPGVGKTYAMLRAGNHRQQEGVGVLVGIVETHGRVETAALLEGMTVLPRKVLMHRSFALEEFDLDAVLQAHPHLVLVDELAHTNVPGSRHPKRYQDVLELLDAGIDVYTTVNVQHIESQVDIVQQITGVVIHETVPDSILDRAHEIQLIDLGVEELLERMREGKVYLGERAEAAAAFDGRSRPQSVWGEPGALDAPCRHPVELSVAGSVGGNLTGGGRCGTGESEPCVGISTKPWWRGCCHHRRGRRCCHFTFGSRA